MPPGSFKSDDSFLSKLAIGAAGTRRVFADLQGQGHDPVELERGSTTFKIWRKTIKRKRIRMPDILCVRCARRFESRGKTDMAISMSHSISDADRAWNTGLAANDFVALVGVSEGTSGTPVDWVADDFVQYVPVNELVTAYDAKRVSISGRKGADEGSEIRVAWPAAVATADGEVTEVTPRLMRALFDTGTVRTVLLARPKGALTALVQVGGRFRCNQIVAAGVPVSQTCACPGGANLATYTAKATSVSLTDRYMVVKALRRFPEAEATAVLLARVADEAEDIYVKVDAAAGLLARDNDAGYDYLDGVLRGEHEQFRLEAAIVLAEVPTDRSATLLRRTLRKPDEHPDIRAAAAWALGELGFADDIDTLIESFSALEVDVRVDAARALTKLARKYRAEALATFPTTQVDRRPGVAWAMAKAGVGVAELLPALIDDDARQWIAYMIGQQDPNTVLDLAALRARDPEVAFAVTVLWKIYGSWINKLEEY